jgi:hypothetical protein
MLFLRRFGILALGVTLLVFGAVQVASDFVLESSFTIGLTSYAPLPAVILRPMPSSSSFGALAALAGVVLVAGWIGFRRGLKSNPRGFIRRYGLFVIGFGLLAGIAALAMLTTGTADFAMRSELPYGPSVVVMPESLVVGVANTLAIIAVPFGCLSWGLGALIARRRHTQIAGSPA